MFDRSLLLGLLSGLLSCTMMHAEPLSPQSDASMKAMPVFSMESELLPLQGHAGLVEEPEWLSRPPVQEELARFSTPAGKAWLNAGLLRAEWYQGFMVPFIESRNLPRDLFWLVMIESVFREKAVSRSGAAGLWQFMKNSVGKSLAISEWVDERFDFWKSTSAALDKLSFNYRETGDWLLAIAAYNAGLGRVSRLMRDNPGLDFWGLHAKGVLPRETMSYVPRFLAVSWMCRNSTRHGLSYTWNMPVDWSRITLDAPVSISRLAAVAGIPPDVLARANGEVKGGISPPGRGVWSIKVPSEYVESIQSALASDAKLIDYRIHTIAKGDTLFGIAKTYKTSVELIESWNPGLNPRALRPDTKIVVPLREAVRKD